MKHKHVWSYQVTYFLCSDCGDTQDAISGPGAICHYCHTEYKPNSKGVWEWCDCDKGITYYTCPHCLREISDVQIVAHQCPKDPSLKGIDVYEVTRTK